MANLLSSHSSKPSESDCSGFSLLEVLASLVVTSLLVMALSPFVTKMLSTWSRGNEMVSGIDYRMRGIGVLRDDLVAAVVWRGFGRAEDSLAFRGNETSMLIPIASGLGDDRLGMEIIAVNVVNAGNGRALVRRRAQVIGTSRTEFGDPVALVSGPYKYIFSYFAVDGSQVPIWSDADSLPTRIEIRVIDESNRRASFSVQMPTVASASAACLANAYLPDCPIQVPQDDANDNSAAN